MKRGTCDRRAAFRSTQSRYDGRLSIGFGQCLLFQKMWLQRYGARSPSFSGAGFAVFSVGELLCGKRFRILRLA